MMPEMGRALAKELSIRLAAAALSFDTLYFGGGTPSLMAMEDLERVIALADEHRTGNRWAECTLEANPEDVTAERCAEWLRLGINRLSIGVQTFDDDLLHWMNRQHSGQQAEEAIRIAAAAGFEHLTADLIYGLPGRTTAQWLGDLDRMMGLPVDHLSAYILTVEPKTVLGHRVQKGLENEPEEEAVSIAYETLCAQTAAAGFAHYEVSNFARPGAEAIHNSRYWAGEAYLGIGPGAHGFDGQKTRWANLANNPLYVQSVLAAKREEELPGTRELLTDADRYNEAIMTGLRTARGVAPEALERAFGLRPDRVEPEAWRAALETGELVRLEGGRVRVAERSWLVGDSVAARFFEV
jgi:oxygen-independent coproporphyrinogen-3 oxidase